MPKVTIAVPNYNHARYLSRRIDSILAQDFADFELIILDDCSPDDSRRVIEGYSGDPRVRTIFNRSNSGNAYKQWSLGLSEAQGEYVWFAESDDYAAPQFLSTLLGRLERHPSVGLAVCQSTIVDEHDAVVFTADEWLEYAKRHTSYDVSLWSDDFVMPGREYCANFLYPWNSIPNGSAVVFRRSALQAAGGVATEVRLCGDWMTYFNVLMVSDIAYVAKPLNYFRTHLNNVRSRTTMDVFYRESQAVIRSIERRIDPNPANRVGWSYMQPFVQGLLAPERRPPRWKVPLSRHWSVLTQSARLSPGAAFATICVLAKEGLAELGYRMRILGLARRIKRRWHAGHEK